MSIPFKIYADTESLLKRIDIKKSKHTKLYQKHIPISIGAKLVCIDNFALIILLYQLKFLQAMIVLIILLNWFSSNKSFLIK